MPDPFRDLCPRIDQLLQKQKTLTLAIDGRCGSGKTTLGNRLGEHFG